MAWSAFGFSVVKSTFASIACTIFFHTASLHIVPDPGVDSGMQVQPLLPSTTVLPSTTMVAFALSADVAADRAWAIRALRFSATATDTLAKAIQT